MNKTQIKRLEKLATHLESGKLGHRKFDFNVINVDKDNPEEPTYNVCGTNGCAMGELPILHPKSWMFDNVKGVERVHPVVPWHAQIENWYGIDDPEANHLFCPEDQNTKQYGGANLSKTASRKSVASNIRAFLKIKTK